ncbi:MAG: ORF6N domain-containing protein [Prolixibacteraceae bacterium]|nr:ORF6N domain-containing protein [Prolixibacteraceae bacterium]
MGKETHTNTLAIPDEVLMKKIYLIRGHKVMLDSDLSEIYDVGTRVLKQAVRRNIKRFPDDFMFELTLEENEILRSQFVTLKRGQHSKYLPFAFTEQGVAMLSSVLNSERAIMVNIQIMRIYVRIREMMMLDKDILHRMESIERMLNRHDNQIVAVFEYLKKLEQTKHQELEHINRPKIGYKPSKK